MNPSEFWQNFKLGEEQEIASNFIYDALRNLHEIETLSQETEIFPILYGLSVGIERMLKVAIVLVEFNENTNIDDFEKSLITHNHLKLFNRLNETTKINLGKAHIEFLNLLSIFYKTHRYDRFNLKSVQNLNRDKKALHSFLHKYLNIDITENFPLTVVWNNARIKGFIGRIVKKITKSLYNVVDTAATNKNIYTYEITGSDSKAAKVLWGGDELNFEDEERVAVESFIYLLNTKESDLINFLKEIKPLDLDPAQDTDYFQLLLPRRSGRSSMILDEVECHYEDVKDIKDRIMRIDTARNPDIIFNQDDEN